MYRFLNQSQLAFYTGTGLRFLHLARQTIPNSAALWLQLGIAQLVNSQGEGLFSLQKAQEIFPQYAPTHQALSLAYWELQRQDLAQFWREKTPTAHLSGDFAYLDFDEKKLCHQCFIPNLVLKSGYNPPAPCPLPTA